MDDSKPMDGQHRGKTPRRVRFVVDGKPEPQPKYKRGKTRSGKKVIYKRDPSGRKLAFATMVAMNARCALRGVMFQGAVRLGVEVRLRQAKSNTKKYPTQIPDWSNIWYYVENILKGVAYKDDCQVIGPLLGDKLWATETEPEGIVVTIEEVL